MTGDTMTLSRVLDRLREAEQCWRSQGDAEHADRLTHALERWTQAVQTQPSVRVVFCGLFSAGKSSLLNRLTETRQFATGAVPTTARMAAVSMPDTEDRMWLVDTPGVDSTDDTHRLETERALAEADVVVLVMDYQHVESDANLELARRLSDTGKPLVLVINQVDKHLEWELPFTDFQARVEQTFAEWETAYERVFYTSAEAGTDLPHNQIDQFRAYLLALADHAGTLVTASVLADIRSAVRGHVEWQMDGRRAEIEDALVETLGYVPFDREEAQALLAERRQAIAELQARRQAAIDELAEQQRTLREQWVRAVELSQIAPYETTERGRQYVESLRDDFRIGWFRSAARTERERAARLEAFVGDLAERTEKYLVWPLQSQLRQFVTATSWAKEAWLADIEQIRVDVTPELCRGAVKPGALVSSQYPYQYVKDVASAVRRQVFVRLTEVVDAWFSEALRELEARLDTADPEAVQCAAEVRTLEDWIALDAEREAQLAEWADLFEVEWMHA